MIQERQGQGSHHFGDGRQDGHAYAVHVQTLGHFMAIRDYSGRAIPEYLRLGHGPIVAPRHKDQSERRQ